MLKELGYSTKKIGKNHNNGGKASHPLDHGFDEFLGFLHHTWDYLRLSEKDAAAYNSRKPGAAKAATIGPLLRGRDQPESYENRYTTDIFAEEAVEFLNRKHDKPFYLHLSFNAVHHPTYVNDPDLAEKFGAPQEPWNREAKDWNFPFWDPKKEGWNVWHRKWGHLGKIDPHGRHRYLACLAGMDLAIGRILDTLENNKLRENTLIIFLADNGGCAEGMNDKNRNSTYWFPPETRAGEFAHKGNDPSIMPGPENTYQSYGPPWANASNTPFRYYKHWTHEGGISSPLVAHWPAGVSAPGTWTDETGHLIDIMATCVDLSGTEYPTEYNGQPIQPFEGRSLAPILRGEAPVAREAIYWEHEGNRAIRQGKWKLVSKWKPPEDGRWELYDMEADRTEMNDLAATMPEKVEAMSALWQTWADRIGVVEWQSWQKS
jgi:arylsulfatase